VPNPFYGYITIGPESGTMIGRSYLPAPFRSILSWAAISQRRVRAYKAFQFKLEKHLTRATMLVSFTDQKQIDE
jgi:hypothetical protein